MSVEPVNNTSVNVTWTPLNLPVVDNYTVHYSIVNGGSGRRRRQSNSGSATFPASVSSGVVSGLMGGQQYQFSVSVTLSVGEVLYMGAPGTPTDATGVYVDTYIQHSATIQHTYNIIFSNYVVKCS